MRKIKSEDEKKRINKRHLAWRENKGSWYNSYFSARARCNNPNQKSYCWYGGKGIKMLMSKEDFKFLWDRDEADKMKKPSIDRIDTDGNYTIENCRFIEMDDNCGRATRGKNSWNRGVSMLEHRVKVTKTLPVGYKRRWAESKDYIANKASSLAILNEAEVK